MRILRDGKYRSRLSAALVSRSGPRGSTDITLHAPPAFPRSETSASTTGLRPRDRHGPGAAHNVHERCTRAHRPEDVRLCRRSQPRRSGIAEARAQTSCSATMATRDRFATTRAARETSRSCRCRPPGHPERHGAGTSNSPGVVLGRRLPADRISLMNHDQSSPMRCPVFARFRGSQVFGRIRSGPLTSASSLAGGSLRRAMFGLFTVRHARAQRRPAHCVIAPRVGRAAAGPLETGFDSHASPSC